MTIDPREQRFLAASILASIALHGAALALGPLVRHAQEFEPPRVLSVVLPDPAPGQEAEVKDPAAAAAGPGAAAQIGRPDPAARRSAARPRAGRASRDARCRDRPERSGAGRLGYDAGRSGACPGDVGSGACLRRERCFPGIECDTARLSRGVPAQPAAGVPRVGAPQRRAGHDHPARAGEHRRAARQGGARALEWIGRARLRGAHDREELAFRARASRCRTARSVGNSADCLPPGAGRVTSQAQTLRQTPRVPARRFAPTRDPVVEGWAVRSGRRSLQR